MIKKCFISASVLFLLLFGGCANKVVPTGGPKDITPPELVNSVPENNAVNFNSSRIEINFDEYIQLKELNKQLVISPPINPKPQISVRKRSVIVEFENPLQEQTTYTINFGNAIADTHEDNPVSGFRYVFSTGEELDSLNIEGEVVNAQTLKPIENVMVLLYNYITQDSLLLNSIPNYFTRTNESGQFKLENLKTGKYYLYAISEQNNNYIFDNSDELVGFITEPVVAGNESIVKVKLFNQYPDKLQIRESKQPVPGKLITVFNKPAFNVTWSFIDDEPEELSILNSKNNDTIIFYGLNPELNSYSIIWLNDGITIDTVTYELPRSVKLNKDKISYSGFQSTPVDGGVLQPETSFEINWDLPIKQIDSNMINVYKDSVQISTPISFTDSLRTTIKIEHDFEPGNYKIKLLKGAVTDIHGLQNDSVSISYFVPLSNSKGAISYKINVNDSEGYFLQLVNREDKLIRQVNNYLKSGTFILLDPGDYFLRLIKDDNRNYQWDRGDYKTKKLPEDVLYYNVPVTVRANWEVEIEWKIVE